MRQALLIVDMINRFDFPGGAALLRQALPVARRLARLRERFHQARQPVIYVNDNFLDWRGGFEDQVAHCARAGMPGAAIARLLAPVARDRYVLKPRHSGFLDSPLELLLRQLRADRLVIGGSPPIRASWPPRTTRTCVASRCMCRATASPRGHRRAATARWH